MSSIMQASVSEIPMQDFGKVSVILPLYNSLHTLERAIDSVLAQTYENWELILIDDASTDGTAERVEQLLKQHGERFTFHRLTQNGGPATARNAGLALSTGEWIAVLDADDAWRKTRLTLLLQHAVRNSADVVCDNLLGFDDHLDQETEPLFDRLPDILDIVAAVAPSYGGSYDLGYLKPVTRRAFVAEKKLSYRDGVRSGEDLEFLLRLLVSRATISCMNEATYIYTTPVGNVSQRQSKSTNTSPRDLQLAHALKDIQHQYQSALSLPEQDAISQRIAFLKNIAPLSEFRHARLARDWPRVIKLALFNSTVRRRILEFKKSKRT